MVGAQVHETEVAAADERRASRRRRRAVRCRGRPPGRRRARARRAGGRSPGQIVRPGASRTEDAPVADRCCHHVLDAAEHRDAVLARRGQADRRRRRRRRPRRPATGAGVPGRARAAAGVRRPRRPRGRSGSGRRATAVCSARRRSRVVVASAPVTTTSWAGRHRGSRTRPRRASRRARRRPPLAARPEGPRSAPYRTRHPTPPRAAHQRRPISAASAELIWPAPTWSATRVGMASASSDVGGDEPASGRPQRPRQPREHAADRIAVRPPSASPDAACRSRSRRAPLGRALPRVSTTPTRPLPRPRVGRSPTNPDGARNLGTATGRGMPHMGQYRRPGSGRGGAQSTGGRQAAWLARPTAASCEETSQLGQDRLHLGAHGGLRDEADGQRCRAPCGRASARRARPPRAG